MQFVKDPRKNKRILLIVGILTIANLSIMATFPKLKLVTEQNVHTKCHFNQAHQLIKESLLPLLKTKYTLSSDYKLYNNATTQQNCCFSGTLQLKQLNKPLTFKVFPKNEQILILDSETKQFVSLKSWLDQ
ncbi:MAG TPA: hypothetical protein DCS93_16510 [Microscillaceae bacterium]|nr:hypothetical protein [Microscillaceae bacterium]